MPASRYRDITSCLRRHADGNAYNKYYESDSPAEIMLYFQQDEKNITKIIIYNFLMLHCPYQEHILNAAAPCKSVNHLHAVHLSLELKNPLFEIAEEERRS